MFRLRSLLTVSLILLAATSVHASGFYVFDCGRIKAMGVETYGFKEGEVKSRDFFVPCYLVVHLCEDLEIAAGSSRISAVRRYL